ncbi:protein DOG1-like 3 [Malania oleifera]|uniref:protein DOG1-like 3 n=1 Tax=Malania oleifera TaxID=397392 RepID=UPI0025AE0AC8|nr:protein DOG1-like 3 [Malania oleifera]
MAGSERDHSRCCFTEWLNTQESDLSDLLRAQAQTPRAGTISPADRHSLAQLAQNIIDHFQDYINKRSHFARRDATAFFAPAWCSPLENSLLWIAGCRPCLYIRLVYALCGSEFESQLDEFLQGTRTGNLGELSWNQFSQVNDLQMKTIREEDRLSVQMAGLQDEVADQPLAVLANKAVRVGEPNREVERALDEHARGMARILEEADELRLRTLKELISFLTPLQAVEFLLAAKKLHLSVREWGKSRDHLHGRSSDPPVS